MTLKFYFDTHIAKAAAIQLRATSVDVTRCEEVGMADAPDADHLEYAAREGRILVTQDADFVALDAQWREVERNHSGIMKLPGQYQGEAQISYLVEQLLFYMQAEQVGAIDYASEIAEQVTFL